MVFQEAITNEYWDEALIDSVLNDYLPQISYQSSLAKWVFALGSIAILYHAMSIVIQNVFRGGEGFSFDMIRKPFFYILLLYAWPYFGEAISFVIEGSVSYVKGVQTNLIQSTLEGADSYSVILTKFEVALKGAEAASLTGNPLFDLGTKMSFIDDWIVYYFFKGIFGFFTFIDAGVLVCFHLVAKIWVYLIVLGMPIAFVVSLFKGSFSALINWGTSLLSVSLWVPVGGLIISLFNSILLKLIEGLKLSALVQLNAFSNGLSSTVTAGFKSDLLFSLTKVTALFLVFLVLKIVLLGKTVQIITTWVGGGSSAGGGLTAAFLAISAVKNVGSTAASGVATGGKSLASGAAKKLKK